MITVHTTSCCACLHCGFLHPSIPSLCMLKFPLLKEKNEIWAESESASISHAIVACQEDTTNTALGTQGDVCKGNIVNSTLLNHQSRFFVNCVKHAPWDFERLGQIPARLHTAGPLRDHKTMRHEPSPRMIAIAIGGAIVLRGCKELVYVRRTN